MVIEALIKIVIVLFVVLTAVSYTVLLERWVSAWVQDRIGPNRVGPLGLFQPLADVLKLLLKEDIEPRQAQKWFHWVAPVISITIAFSVLAVVPFGHVLMLGTRVIPLTIASSINIGVLFIVALSSLGVYGITLAGWSSGSKYSLLGGLRSSAQMISYELVLGLGLISVVMLTGSLDLNTIIDSQAAGLWNIIRAPSGISAVFHCLIRGDQSVAVRSSGSRAGTGWRVSYGIQFDEIRTVFPGRICEHHHRKCDNHRALPGRLACSLH